MNKEVVIPNRYLCDVLGEMRKCHETRNYSYLQGLIEEAQVMGNRMESKLRDYSDAKWDEKKIKSLKKQRKELEEEIEKLEEQRDEIDTQEG